jgi:hypothetical protein
MHRRLAGLRRAIAPYVLILSLWPWAAQAQSQLSGTVTDNSRAILVGAVVTLRNVNTGIALKAATNGSGIYSLPSVQTGSYELTCELPGFKKFEEGGLVMETGASRLVDIQLELGQLSESVRVAGTAPLLDAQTSSVGQLVERATVANMPLSTRRATSLVKLMGNVSFGSETQADSTPYFSMAGGRSGDQMWNLDGAVVQNMTLGVPLITLNPSAETIQEFKIEANNFSAEFGRAGSGLINMTTRSGTNTFHGAAYEFLRNDKMDARSFFARQKVPLKSNIFGTSIGGPVRKDRTFFFANYEGVRRNIGATVSNTSVPHPAEKLGDFSARRDVVLTDPLSKAPFPGNRIPAARIDAAAAKLVRFYPDPNIANNDITRAPLNNYLTNVADATKVNSVTARVDHMFNDNNRIYGRMNYILTKIDTGNVYPTLFADFRSNEQRTMSAAFAGNWTRNLRPNLINDLRVNYTRRSNFVEASSGNSDPKLGIPGVEPLWFPAVTASGISGLGQATWRLQTPIPSYQAIDTLTWIKGKHQVKTGFEFRYSRNGDANRNSAGGAFNFGNRATGNSTAELLLGWVNSASRAELPRIDSRSDFWGAFVQDDWRVSQKLTLNIGVRWDMDTPRHAFDNRQTGFDGRPINPVSGTPGVFTFAGRDGYSRYAHDFDKNNFGPKAGFAYRFNDKTVVRGGYGIAYVGIYSVATPVSLISGFSTSISVASLDGGFTPAFLLAQGLPAVPQQPLGPGYGAAAKGAAPFSAPEFIQKNQVNGYMQQWNLTVQRELGQSVMVEAAYVSNIGHKLGAASNISVNMVPLVNGRGPARQDQQLRPFPQFNNVTWISGVWGDSNYQSLNLKFEKRYSSGLNLLSNFTWSKFLDNIPATGQLGGSASSFQHIELHRLDWSISANDIPKRWITSTVYELPFGKGRHWAIANPVLKAIAGGWGVGVIADVRSGAPWGVAELTNTSNTFSISQRSNLLRNPNLSAGRSRADRIAGYFDTAAFAPPEAGTFGNAARNLGYGPGLVGIDVSLHKLWVVREPATLQFRTDIYNLPNTPSFDNPGGSRGASNFGRISSTRQGTERILQFSLRLEF